MLNWNQGLGFCFGFVDLLLGGFFNWKTDSIVSIFPFLFCFIFLEFCLLCLDLKVSETLILTHVIDRYSCFSLRWNENNWRPAERDTIFFDSHDVSKPDSVSSLSILDEDEKCDGRATLRAESLDKLVAVLRSTLRMSLFGVDIVIEKSTGLYAIIDINAFPGISQRFVMLDTCQCFVIEETHENLTFSIFYKIVFFFWKISFNSK